MNGDTANEVGGGYHISAICLEFKQKVVMMVVQGGGENNDARR